jgi:translation initiation factor 2B subunit (eIF-2B alpha/beta/delta family)
MNAVITTHNVLNKTIVQIKERMENKLEKISEQTYFRLRSNQAITTPLNHSEELIGIPWYISEVSLISYAG